MTAYPVPATLMPRDQLTAAGLNANVRDPLKAGFRRPRAKLIYTQAASLGTGTQPLALGWDSPTHGSTIYDDAFDGSTMVNAGANGFQVVIPDTYRIRGRVTWAYNASASAGVRYLGLYLDYNNFVSIGGAIGAVPSGVYGDAQALRFDYCRWINGAPCSAKIDHTMPLIEGACLQLGIFQNSGVSLAYVPGAAYMWFTIEAER
ncbi:MAG: hypothetical protein ACRDU4_00745 [Mycobacterium sp.]